MAVSAVVVAAVVVIVLAHMGTIVIEPVALAQKWLSYLPRYFSLTSASFISKAN